MGEWECFSWEQVPRGQYHKHYKSQLTLPTFIRGYYLCKHKHAMFSHNFQHENYLFVASVGVLVCILTKFILCSYNLQRILQRIGVTTQKYIFSVAKVPRVTVPKYCSYKPCRIPAIIQGAAYYLCNLYHKRYNLCFLTTFNMKISFLWRVFPEF